jgi:hypothetical protein
MENPLTQLMSEKATVQGKYDPSAWTCHCGHKNPPSAKMITHCQNCGDLRPGMSCRCPHCQATMG